jgi:hypothetical protein
MRTGGCTYGAACKFNHPPEKAVARNADGMPIRPVRLCHFRRCRFLVLAISLL